MHRAPGSFIVRGRRQRVLIYLCVRVEHTHALATALRLPSEHPSPFQRDQLVSDMHARPSPLSDRTTRERIAVPGHAAVVDPEPVMTGSRLPIEHAIGRVSPADRAEIHQLMAG